MRRSDTDMIRAPEGTRYYSEAAVPLAFLDVDYTV
jgi:hypothetical protein